MVDEIDDLPPIKLLEPTRRDTCDRPSHWLKHPRHLSVVEMRLAQVHLDVQEYARPVRGLLIGENPGPNTSWATPLFPWPPTSSAGRLMDMAALDGSEYLGCLLRRNLCDEPKWFEGKARLRARAILTALFDMPKELRVVLCGVKVADAFDVRHKTEFWMPVKLESRQTAVVIPHPSGMNRIYNDREARLMTGAWLRWAAMGEDHP